MVGEWAVYKWELETVVTSRLTTPKDRPGRRNTNIRMSKFEALTVLFNILGDVEKLGIKNNERCREHLGIDR